MANYHIGFGYKVTNGWYARSNSTAHGYRVYERTQTQSTQACVLWLNET